ncbi:MAG: hypothetical protein Q4P08_02735 [Eubacteriales bacterium]|nr:hypothetical protein [Eubacteriales bacterium]
MKIKAFYIRADGADPRQLDEYNQNFAAEISAAAGLELELSTEVESLRESAEELGFHFIFIGSGGSEMQFSKHADLLSKPVLLITTQANNSLPASMEILTFLHDRNQQGEILHGEPEQVALALREEVHLAATKQRLKGMRIGNTGRSDWLIASGVDPELLKERSGLVYVDVPMSEIMAEIERDEYPQNAWTEELKRQNWPEEQMERALQVYGGVKRVAERYNLKGISLRCFDLLAPYKISGCLALAILNAEGFWAACEGDAKSLVSMTVIGEITGQPVFMANPSRLDFQRNHAVLAHCVLPLNMPEKYSLATHFESGLGVSVAGEFNPGPITLFKMKGDFVNYHVQEGELLRNLHEGCLCRTQLELHLPDGLDYFVKRPIANHQMLVLGHHADKVRRFFAQYREED